VNTETSVKFDAFDLNKSILSRLKVLNFDTPTPIQQKSIPAIMKGGDVIGLAQTGTGKTAAFVLPILHRLMEGAHGRIRALIIAPTRELAEQINEALNDLGRECGLRSVTLYGGMSMFKQIQKLRRGVEIVVACPGRLLDHIKRGNVNLGGIEVVVLDEADQMFDMGFLPDIREILQKIPAKRQALLFSATMPGAVRQLAQDMLKDPVTIQIGHAAPAASVKQALFPVAPHQKTELLIKILRETDTGSVLIFTRTKQRAEHVAEQLNDVGYHATSLQGNLSQSQRQRALKSFRDGSLQILVATDIASRGIDVTRISHVINYDMPNTVEAYIHRIGRTGRAAKIGDAFTLLTREDTGLVRGIERVLGTKIEQRVMPGFEPTASSHTGRGRGHDGGANAGKSRGGYSGRSSSSRSSSGRSSSGRSSSRDGQGGQRAGGYGHASNGRSSTSRTSEGRSSRDGQGGREYQGNREGRSYSSHSSSRSAAGSRENRDSQREGRSYSSHSAGRGDSKPAGRDNRDSRDNRDRGHYASRDNRDAPVRARRSDGTSPRYRGAAAHQPAPDRRRSAAPASARPAADHKARVTVKKKHPARAQKHAGAPARD